MSFLAGWTRRRFLAVSGGAAAQAAAGLKGLAQSDGIPRDTVAKEAAAALPPPGVITGGTVPLLNGHTARPLRYTPVNGEFVVRNGREFFNRPIYGPNNDFRVDAGDLPEFSLYLPGHGGNLKLGFIAGAASKWAAAADEVVAKYRPGRMIYEIRDALLGSGMMRAELLTAGTGSGLIVKVEGQGLPPGIRLAWAFGGVSGRKGKRNGDIGCEVEPVSQFFQVRAEECDGNSYILDRRANDGGGGGISSSLQVNSKAAQMMLTFPSGSQLRVEDFSKWLEDPSVSPQRDESMTGAPVAPILTGSSEIKSSPLFVTLDADVHASSTPPSRAFNLRSAEVERIASTLAIDTPDEYLNAAAPALGIAADTIWDAKQECVMHGGVAWRVPLAGWRGPYSLDALGNHDRAKLHFRHWLKRQNVSPVATAGMVDGEATGPWDPKMHLARKEGMLHSNGDLSNNHYDMNLVFFDVLLRHLRWTGDMDFAREIWPAFERHLAWERRLFRREYVTPAGTNLPLYEAYAAIWASDNLQYNGGGAAHSSAYNVFALREAAKLAKMLGATAEAYEAEAALVHRAMQELLWLPKHGAFGESKDLLGPQTVYSNPANWTAYHTIDSEVPTPRQAWQMAAEQLGKLRRVPVHGDAVPAGDWYMVACSDWLPYLWSLTLLVLAENVHLALAMWQAGMSDEAYRLFKGNLLDSMYTGLCPGDFHMSSALDAHRQEAQRDFGDPIGISSRALVEGLFGVRPDLIAGELRLCPGLPSDWDRATMRHKDFDFTWSRDGMQERYEFTSRLPRQAPLMLSVPARTTSLPTAASGGIRVVCSFDVEAVGSPRLKLMLPAALAYKIDLAWHGSAPAAVPAIRSYAIGEQIVLPDGTSLALTDDPQGCHADGRAALPGHHTIFVNMHQADCRWSMPITFDVKQAALQPVPSAEASARTEMLDLSPVLRHQVTQVFTRSYAEPRSPFCSLAIPEQLIGGWANLDGMAIIDDAGLRAAGGVLKTAIGVNFRTPSGNAPNCLFLSHWKGDEAALKIALAGRAAGIYLLMTGTTLPQCSRMQHGAVLVTYTDGTVATLSLRNPETWWPIEQDYLLDDYLFVNDAPLPPRIDLRSGRTRILDPGGFKGRGRAVPGGAATILHLPLDPRKTLAALEVKADLYGIVLGLLAATLLRA